MAIFSNNLCKQLATLGVGVSSYSEFVGSWAFNAPVSFNPYTVFARSKIDSFSYINFNTVCKTSSIGRYCSIADHVNIGMEIPDLSQISTSRSFSRTNIFDFAGYHVDRLSAAVKKHHGEETSIVKVGNDVWIGSHVIIPKDVNIGHGAVIGAGAVITKDVPPYAVVVGYDRIVKYRFSDEIISDFLELNWWNYNIPKMIQTGVINEEQLNDPKAFIEFFKNADPATLVPLLPKWYLMELKSSAPNNIALTPVSESVYPFMNSD